MFSYQRIANAARIGDNTNYDNPPGCSHGTVSVKDGFLDSGLKAHNTYRAKHGVPSLKLSRDLTDMAQAYAEQLAKRHKFEHSAKDARKGAGENLYGCTGSVPKSDNGEQAVTSWYNEIEGYKFVNGIVTPEKYSHFSQVVWKETEELGMGVAADNGWIIVVANYRPAGNLVGSFRQNVLPPAY